MKDQHPHVLVDLAGFVKESTQLIFSLSELKANQRENCFM